MSDLMLRLGTLVDELKRRGVLRVGAVYLVGAWLLIQVADVTFPRLGLPDWTVTFVIVLGALLFPVVIGIAWAFDFTRRGLERTPAREPEHVPVDGALVPVPAHAKVRPHGTIAAAALISIPLIGFGLWWVNDARGYALDPDLVAITPFRVAGAAAEAHYLREGLMDLIAARVGGAGGGMKVVAPRTVSRTLRDQLGSLDADPDQSEALALARELGAGRLLEGEVVGGGDRLTVTAALYDVSTGDRVGPPASIRVHPDSLHDLVDEIATHLIAAGSGVSGDQLAHLTTASLPALHAFLDGEHAFRRGQHNVALRAYARAVSLDTTFALAALGLLRAQGWSPGAPAEISWDRAERIVHRGLDRLSERDRLYYEAFTGGTVSSLRDLVTLRLRAAERAPDAAELHYLAGDGLFHWGDALGMESARARARAFFEETIALDSAYLEPLIHLHDIAIFAGDTAGVRRWGDALLAIDSTSTFAVAVRFTRTLGHAGPAPALATERIDLDTLGNPELVRLTSLGGLAPDPRVAGALVRRFESPTMPDEAGFMARVIERMGMRGGQPSLRALAAPHQPNYDGWGDLDGLTVAIYWLRDVDSVRAASAVVRDALARARATGGHPAEIAFRECLLGHAAITEGDLAAASRAASFLETTPAADREGTFDDSPAENQRACALFLQTAVAVYGRAPDALRRLETYDDTLRSGVPIDQYGNQVYQLAIARLWEHAGRPERALAAVRRLIYLPWASHWHTEMWGEEARLADQLGRRDEAIDAYRRYLSYLEHAEPPFRERADAARARLAALVGERSPQATSDDP